MQTWNIKKYFCPSRIDGKLHRRRSLALLITIAGVSLCTPSMAKEISEKERQDLYEHEGMDYAKKLYTKLDGSKEDEERNQKSELLNYQLRKQTIEKTEALLKKNKNKNLIAEFLRRLGKLHEQQAETVSRRSDIKDKSALIKRHVETAIRNFERVNREYPNFYPDDTLYSLGDNYLKLKNSAKAEQNFTKITQKYSQSAFLADAFLELGNISFERKNFARARQNFGRIQTIKESTLIPFSFYKIAWCFFNEGDVDSAIAGLVDAIKESRRLSSTQKNGKKLGVEDEALADLVLFFSEKKDANGAKAFFETIVDREKAKELRVQLAKRFFDHGQNKFALQTAADVLADKPAADQITKLHMIVISASEKTNDRKASIEHLGKISVWLKNNPQPEAVTAEAEEFIRNFALKLHHEAETLKKKEIWANAKHAYISYLETFTKEKEIPEMRYRLAVLLMHLSENRNAYEALQPYFATPEIATHARHKDSRKLQIQTFELAKGEVKNKFTDKEMLSSYEAFANEYPKEDLAPEAAFKAAQIAKKFEQPEIISQRFRKIAAAYPKHSLAKSCISESLSILVKGEKWGLLRTETTLLLENSVELRDKISEARELAVIKLVEQDEKANKFAEVKKQLEDFLKEKPSQASALFALLKLAKLAELNMNDPLEAIKYYETLRANYAQSKEATSAILEIARLQEKTFQLKLAAKTYAEFSRTGKEAIHQQALTNSVLLFEGMGDRLAAAAGFQALHDFSTKTEEKKKALIASCNNYILATNTNKDTALYDKILTCSESLTSLDTNNQIHWLAHLAWAQENSGLPSESRKTWKKLAQARNKNIPEEAKAYVGYARSLDLQNSLDDLKAIRFSGSNEKPEVNIGKKTKAMELLEAKVQAILPYSAPKTATYAKEIIGLGYLDFADVMENAAVPSRLTDQEKIDLKNSFVTLAKDLREKAYVYAPQLKEKADKKDGDGREVASVEKKKFKAQFSGDKLSESEWKETLAGIGSADKDLASMAKIAAHFYDLEQWGEARYAALRWKQSLAKQSKDAKIDADYALTANEALQADLQNFFPEQDPLAERFF